MKVKSFLGGFDKNFCYLVWCEKTKIAGIVDPSVAIQPIIEKIEKENLFLDKIFITHTHHDHIFYLDDYKYLYPNLKIICHEKPEKSFKYSITKQEDYELTSLGEEIFISIHSPGHHSDSICYYNEKNKILFTGDTIFVGRTGRTIGNKSNIIDLYKSVYNKILTLSPDTIIYPGHNYGYKKCISIKENIELSDFFQCKSLDEFKNIMKKFEDNRKR